MSRRHSSSRKRKSSRRKGKARIPSYSSLTAREKATYDRTTNLVTDLRRGEGSYTALLRMHHLGSRTARKYAGRDLLDGSRGKPVRAMRRSCPTITTTATSCCADNSVSPSSKANGAEYALRVRKFSPMRERF